MGLLQIILQYTIDEKTRISLSPSNKPIVKLSSDQASKELQASRVLARIAGFSPSSKSRQPGKYTPEQISLSSLLTPGTYLVQAR